MTLSPVDETDDVFFFKNGWSQDVGKEVLFEVFRSNLLNWPGSGGGFFLA